MIIVFLLLAFGIIINILLTGFNTLNIIYLTASLILIIISRPSVKNMMGMGKDRKKDFIFNTVICIVFLAVFFIGGLVFSPYEDNYNNDIEQSIKLIEKGEYGKAEAILLELLDKDSSNPVVNQNLGVLYLNQKQADKAVGYLNRVNAPYDENLFFNYGMYYYQKEDYSNALKYFEKAAALNPSMANAHVYAGTMSAKQGDIKRAVYHFKNAGFLLPKEPSVYYHLGRCFMRQMDYDEAILNFNKALELNPDNALKDEINYYLKTINEQL